MNRDLSINNKGRLFISTKIIYFCLLFLFLLFPTSTGKIPPYLLVIVLGIPYLLGTIVKSKFSIKISNFYMIYYAFTYLASLFLHYYSGSIIISISFIAYFIISPMIVKRTIFTKRDFETVISIIVFVFAVYSVFGIVECLSGFNVFDKIFGRSETVLWEAVDMQRYGMNLSYGFLRIMHNNASMMCMIWAIAAYKICNTSDNKVFWVICWGLIGTYDMIMMSRMVIFTAPLLQLIIFRKQGFRWLYKRIVIVLIIILIIIVLFGSKFFQSFLYTIAGLFAPIIDELFGTTFKRQLDSTLGGSGQRLILWEWIIDAVKSNFLFGKGYTDVWSRTVYLKNSLGLTWSYEKTSIEVQWLLLLYRTGIFGLSGFIVFQFGVIYKTWKAKINCFEQKVSFQFVMRWISIIYFFQLFAIAAAEEMNIFYFLFAIYLAYINICKAKDNPFGKTLNVKKEM